MKHLFIGAVISLLSLAGYAQTDSMIMPGNIQIVNGKPEDGLFLQQNKMMKIENGKVMEMELDERLADESTVSKMGMIQRQDGSTMQMLEGDFLKMNGMLVPGPKREMQKQ